MSARWPEIEAYGRYRPSSGPPKRLTLEELHAQPDDGRGWFIREWEWARAETERRIAAGEDPATIVVQGSAIRLQKVDEWYT